MAKMTVKRGLLIAGVAILFFLLGSFVAYLRLKDNNSDSSINSSFKNPVGAPSIEGPSGPPPVDFGAPGILPPKE